MCLNNKLHFLCWALCLTLAAEGALAKPSDRRKFESEHKTLLRRIKDIRQILAENTSKKQASLGALKALNQQIASNALLIKTMGKELAELNEETQQKKLAIGRMRQDLVQLEHEYATMVYMGSKTLHDIHQLMFLLATPSFHQLVQRFQHVKQYARTRQQHLSEIKKVQNLLQKQHRATTRRQKKQKALLRRQQAERTQLQRLKKQQTRLVQRLGRQHQQLSRELAQRNRAVRRLDQVLGDVIRKEQRGKTVARGKKVPPPGPGSDALTLHFYRHRGQLPWPVEKGFISGQFGIGPHPVLKNVQIENLGVDIQTQPNARALALCQGTVKAIVVVPGMHRAVMVQHGAYRTVYAKLKDTCVKAGQQVQAQAPLGTVATDAQGTTELQLQVWQETQKLNPAQWLRAQ